MFVINANNDTNSNGGYGVVNGYLENNLDGQYYTLFPVRGNYALTDSGGKFYYCSLTWASPTSSPTMNQLSYWNGDASNACSLFNEYKINDTDHAIIYPFHWTGLCNFVGYSDCHYNFSGYLCACSNTKATAGNTCPTKTIYNFNAYTGFDNITFYRFAGKKKFCGGEIIGRNIRGLLTACINNNFTNAHWQNGSTDCCWRIINTCPFSLEVDIGLIHTDGTKSCLICCDMPFPYGCITNPGGTRGWCYLDNICSSATTCRSGCRIINVLPGDFDTDGIEAEEGDRIFIEYKTKGCIKPQLVFTNCSYSHGTFCNCAFQIYSNNVYCQFSGYNNTPRMLYNYVPEECNRYQGISFSIE